MRVTVSQLRGDIYNLLDRVIETGEPLEIERHGVIVRVIAPRAPGWLDRLPRREGVIVGDPEDLVHMDWSATRRPDLS
jgi:antitoxin (DNA-binding transcriptional repressor) of toxin-antitoxin stability system